MKPAPSSALIIVPAYNESAALPQTLRLLSSTLPDFDVVVVDDGSTDNTAAVARAVGVPVLTLPYNLGIGGALRTGFRYAVEHGYTRALQFDADGQHPHESVPALVAAIDEGADLAIGSRFALDDSNYAVSPARGWAMRSLRWLVRRFTGKKFTDTSSGFRAFSQPMLTFFSTNYPAEYMESVEALIIAHAAGFQVVEIPVQMSERMAGTPSNRNFRLIYHFARVFLVIAVTKRRQTRREQPQGEER